mgnify:FL=1
MNHKPIIQSFLIKTNIRIDIVNLIEHIEISTQSVRSGSILAVKYKDVIKGNASLFKSSVGFKNSCHLLICYIAQTQQKKFIQVKITSLGTFQLSGVPMADVEKLIYKFFSTIEKLNKKFNGSVFQTTTWHRFEMVLVPLLYNCVIELPPAVRNKVNSYSKLQLINRFIEHGYISFIVPYDIAVTIKQPCLYEYFKKHPIRYSTWHRSAGKTMSFIEYESYTTLLTEEQRKVAICKKYLTFRMFSTGKILVSGFNEITVNEGIARFLKMCENF